MLRDLFIHISVKQLKIHANKYNELFLSCFCSLFKIIPRPILSSQNLDKSKSSCACADLLLPIFFRDLNRGRTTCNSLTRLMQEFLFSARFRNSCEARALFLRSCLLFGLGVRFSLLGKSFFKTRKVSIFATRF